MENYASDRVVIRKIDDLTGKSELVHRQGGFTVHRIVHPYFEGFEYWVVNDKGFLWEGATSLEASIEFLKNN